MNTIYTLAYLGSTPADVAAYQRALDALVVPEEIETAIRAQLGARWPA